MVLSMYTFRFFLIFISQGMLLITKKKQLFNILCNDFLKNGHTGGEKATSDNNNITYRLNYFI